MTSHFSSLIRPSVVHGQTVLKCRVLYCTVVSRLRENIRRNRPELVQGSKETWIHTSLSFGQEAFAFCCPGPLLFLPSNKISLSQTTVGTLVICCFNKLTPLLKVWLEIAGVFEPHPTYSSLELAPCGFFVFYKIYFHLKGRTFWLIKELEEFEGTF